MGPVVLASAWRKEGFEKCTIMIFSGLISPHESSRDMNYGMLLVA